MSGGLLGIGTKSLLAYQLALSTASQNISKANVPFYSRRTVEFADNGFGAGVSVADVRRIYDDVTSRDLLAKTSSASKLESFYNSIADFEKMLDDGQTNVSKYLNDAINAVQTLTGAANGNIQSRSAFLNQLSGLANRISAMGGEIQKKKNDLNSSILNTITQTNTLLDQIGKINTKIRQQTSENRDDLLDQRNALVHELAKSINFSTYTDENDELTISVSNGLQIVAGSTVNHFSAVANQENQSLYGISLESGYGDDIDVTSFITEGNLGGMISLRQTAYDEADRGLGRMALALAAVFNAQNKLGSDMNGNLGGNIFSDINTTALMRERIGINSNNTGTGTMSLSIDDVKELQTSDYRLSFTSETDYTIMRISDGEEVATGTITAVPHSATFDGMTLSITAADFEAGDNFLIKPYEGASSSTSVTMTDARKLALAYPVSASQSKSNMGQGQIQVTSIEDTTNSIFATPGQLSPPIRVEFLTETTYRLVNANDDSVLETGLTYDPTTGSDVFPTAGSFDPGFRVSITGPVKAGDTFTLDYNMNTVGDNRNAIEMAGIFTRQILDGGNSTLNQAYVSLSSMVSLQTNTAGIEYKSADALQKQSETRFYEQTGVVAEEEQTNLLIYQQSYAASAKIIEAARNVFETIMAMMR